MEYVQPFKNKSTTSEAEISNLWNFAHIVCHVDRRVCFWLIFFEEKNYLKLKLSYCSGIKIYLDIFGE